MHRWIRPYAGAHRTAIIALALVLIGAAAFFTAHRVGAQSTPAPADSGTASNGELEIAVKAGFGRLEVNNWNGAWVPFRISVANQGPAIAGRLIVHTESNNGPTSQAREFVKEIQLPTGSHQSHIDCSAPSPHCPASPAQTSPSRHRWPAAVGCCGDHKKSRNLPPTPGSS